MAPMRVQVVQTVQIVQPSSLSSPACTGEKRGSENSLNGAKRLNGLNALNRHAAVSDRQRKSPPALLVQRPRADHTCSRSASCPCAIYETALCDGSDCPACGRKRLRRPVRDEAAPRTSPCPGSSGSGRQACDARLRRSLALVRPNLSRGERPAHSYGRERGILLARVASFP